MAQDNATLQGADLPSRFLAWTGPQLLVIAGCAALSRLTIGRLHGVWWLALPALSALVFWLVGDYRMDAYASNMAGWLRRRLLRLVGRAEAEKLGVDVQEDYLETPDGMRQIIGVDTTSLDALTPTEQDTLCDALARLARTRQPGQTMQFLVINRALDGDAVMADLRASIQQNRDAAFPADLAEMARYDLDALARQMRTRFVGSLSAYIIVGAPPRQLFAEQDALASLRRTSETVRGHLAGLGLGSRVLPAPQVLTLLEGEPNDMAGFTEESPRSVKVGGNYAATIALLEPCEITSPGYLAPLIAGLSVPYRLSIHMTGLDRTYEARRFSRRKNVEAEDEKGAAQHGRMLLRSQRTGVVRWGVYLTVFAPTLPHLRGVVGQAQEMMEVDLPCRMARLLGHQAPAYWATLPTGHDTCKRTWRIDTPTVGNAFPFLDFNPGTREGFPLGFAAGNQLVRLQPDDPDHRNAIVNIYGLTGSGKTVTGLLLLKWALYSGARGTVIERTGDPDRGIPSHYATFCAIAGGTMLYLGDESPPSLNMWDGSVRHIVGAHEIMMGRPGQPFPPLWHSLVSQGVRAVKAMPGDVRESDLYMWLLCESDAESKRPLVERDILREMAAILEPYIGDGEYAPLFDRPTSINLDSRLLVFNTRGVDDHLSPVLMYLITDAVARRGRKAGEQPPITLLDEGWAVAKYEAGAQALEEWGRRGRHTSMFLVFLTQAIRDLRHNPIAASLFEAASITILMRLTDAGVDGASEMAQAFGLTERETETVRRLQTVRAPQRMHGHAEAFVIRQSRTRATTVRHRIEIHTNPVDATAFLSDPLAQVWRRQRFIEEMGSAWAGCKAMAEVPALDDEDEDEDGDESASVPAEVSA